MTGRQPEPPNPEDRTNSPLNGSSHVTPAVPAAGAMAGSARPLSRFQLLVLQLHACGYSPEQIAGLAQHPVSTVHATLVSAAIQLGSPGNWQIAAAIARRRGLIQ